MTPQERELLEALFARVRSASGQQRDPEAEAFIAGQVQQAPHAAYLLSQTVIVQEETLKAAAAKIEELNAQIAELEEAQQAAQEPPSFLGGIGKSLFGGDDRPAQRSGSVPSAGAQRDFGPSAQPSAFGGGAPNPGGIAMPSMAPNSAASASRWTQQGRPIAGAAPQQEQAAGGGNSFLKGALGAAAGVAGGVLLANTLGGLFKDSSGDAAASGAKAAAPAGGEAQTASATPAAAENKPWGADSASDTGDASDDGYDDDAWADDDGGDDDDWGDED